MRSEEGRESIYAERPLASAPTGYLLGDLVRQVKTLAQREVELAKAEMRSMIRSQAQRMASFLAAALCGFLGLGLIAAALVLLLAKVMPVWVSALVVGALVLGVAFALGSSAKAKRIHKPLERTKQRLKEDFQWVKERVA
jgi:Putative Actinobacterial Holin-X, holin superfamily III